MSGVAQTSVENYHQHRDTGRLGKQARELYLFLYSHAHCDWSRTELAEALGIRLSSVCGRINELLNSQHIEESFVRQCRVTGKTVRPVRLKSLF